MVELLSPAGNMEKLRAVIDYGADAVYLAGKAFGMRAASDNFTDEELAVAAEYVHSRGKKLYVTLNVMPRTKEYLSLGKMIDTVNAIGAHGVIAGDIGVISLIRERAPLLPIHLSTQACAVSAAACRAWHKLGVGRIVLARELTLDEIREIRADTPESLELEVFIHGSMCISYSGRCLLSNYLTGRDANRGNCVQPCRWNYGVSHIEMTEEHRQGERFSVFEDAHGAYIMSSRDLCMIEHVPAIMSAGINSFKIEGRMKSTYYGALVTNAYRIAIDRYEKDPTAYINDPALLHELCSVSHREYCTGFFFGNPMEDAAVVSETGYLREKAYLAIAEEYNFKDGRALFRQRNKLVCGEAAELISPGKTGRRILIDDMRTPEGEALQNAPHPDMKFTIRVPFEIKTGDILRGV